MESSIAEFLKRKSACELLPTTMVVLSGKEVIAFVLTIEDEDLLRRFVQDHFGNNSSAKIMRLL